MSTLLHHQRRCLHWCSHGHYWGQQADHKRLLQKMFRWLSFVHASTASLFTTKQIQISSTIVANLSALFYFCRVYWKGASVCGLNVHNWLSKSGLELNVLAMYKHLTKMLKGVDVDWDICYVCCSCMPFVGTHIPDFAESDVYFTSLSAKSGICIRYKALWYKLEVGWKYCQGLECITLVNKLTTGYTYSNYPENETRTYITQELSYCHFANFGICIGYKVLWNKLEGGWNTAKYWNVCTVFYSHSSWYQRTVYPTCFSELKSPHFKIWYIYVANSRYSIHEKLLVLFSTQYVDTCITILLEEFEQFKDYCDHHICNTY